MSVSVPYRGATFLNCYQPCWTVRLAATFPSPIGELHFSIILASLNEKGCNKVSVPYRGATFLNDELTTEMSDMSKFPSPIGELHFSIEYGCAYGTVFIKPFPSPIGELHFSIA